MSTTETALTLFWFRRDLRLEDNTGLIAALESGRPVLCIFIFDKEILDELPEQDARLTFIHAQLGKLHAQLQAQQSGLYCVHADVEEALARLCALYPIHSVYANRDYEPYALQRDAAIRQMLEQKGIEFRTFKDQVIFEPGEVMKPNQAPYTIYTPYKNTWLNQYQKQAPRIWKTGHFAPYDGQLPTLEDIGFKPSQIQVRPFTLQGLERYKATRDIPSLDATSYLSPHLRFGTVSIRQVIAQIGHADPTFLNELIWREFFMQILYYFPHSVRNAFKAQYDLIEWENDAANFARWCEGKTGYPMVDAGMRQLVQTGMMHNRVRMVTASFLCKHLLIDWRWGEAFFARHLLDFDLSANVGNWQWAAGSGCDAAPYFRVFNPSEQQRKFDPDFIYIKHWVPEYGTPEYPEPIVDHAFARQRAIARYKKAVSAVE